MPDNWTHACLMASANVLAFQWKRECNSEIQPAEKRNLHVVPS